LADLFCRLARRRVQAAWRALRCNDDRPSYRIAQEALAGRFEWLEDGLV
jgi:hypothetical protein